MSAIPDHIQDDIADHIDAIKAHFKPEMKIMVVVRSPDHPGGRQDFAMGDDDPREAANALLLRAAPGPVTIPVRVK